ncbi:hypothetical protein [Acetobacterium carbinolicum]|uniref:hypothetical protein n=1 Tax=Acetobacterium carbinolicum TaxID=52690 RepID=UPI0039C8C790
MKKRKVFSDELRFIINHGGANIRTKIIESFDFLKKEGVVPRDFKTTNQQLGRYLRGASFNNSNYQDYFELATKAVLGQIEYNRLAEKYRQQNEFRIRTIEDAHKYISNIPQAELDSSDWYAEKNEIAMDREIKHFIKHDVVSAWEKLSPKSKQILDENLPYFSAFLNVDILAKIIVVNQLFLNIPRKALSDFLIREKNSNHYDWPYKNTQTMLAKYNLLAKLFEAGLKRNSLGIQGESREVYIQFILSYYHDFNQESVLKNIQQLPDYSTTESTSKNCDDQAKQRFIEACELNLWNPLLMGNLLTTIYLMILVDDLDIFLGHHFLLIAISAEDEYVDRLILKEPGKSRAQIEYIYKPDLVKKRQGIFNSFMEKLKNL